MPQSDLTSVELCGQVAGRLLASDSSGSLVAALEDLLEEFGAVPARLYLRDPAAEVYYAAAGLGCERDAPDLPVDSAGDRILRLRGPDGAIGLLVLGKQPAADLMTTQRLAAVAALLGPILVSMHQREMTAGALRRAEEQIRMITSAGDLLRHMELEVLLVKILETVLGAARAQVGALLVPGESGALEAKVTWGLRPEHVAALRLADGRRLVEAVHADGHSLVFSGDLAGLDATRLDAKLTGLLALPLTTRGTSMGVVLAANPTDCGEDERRMAETLCSLAAIALDNAVLVKATVDRERLKQEMDLARAVQTAMSPTGPLAVGSLLTIGHSKPCNETGGDYYTYLLRGGRLLAMIGDVSGHGLGAALFTTMAHAIIQQQLRSGAPIAEAFRVLNEGLYHAQSGRFMTAALVEIEVATGRFSYVSAGHNPLLWLSSGEPRWLESGGLPLGILGDSEYPLTEPGALALGDRMILYTDGFTEAVSPAGECFGEERLARTARNAWELRQGPAETGVLLSSDVDAWAQGKPHADDLTMVVISA